MARFAALLLVALVAGAFVAQTNAMLALCDAKAAPPTPSNVQIIKNAPGPKGPELLVSWASNAKDTAGCVSFWRVITVVNGKEVKEEGVMSTSPGQPSAQFTPVGIRAGDTVSFKVYAMNKDTQKKSGLATTAAVKAAAAGATTGRKML